MGGMPRRATKMGVAAARPMETFGKAFQRLRGASATVIRVGRLALLACAAALLLGGGAAAALLAPGSDAAATTRRRPPRRQRRRRPRQSARLRRSSPSPGHGWGHGLGLSQWGAYGYARTARLRQDPRPLLPGNDARAARVATVRVLVASKQKVTLASTTPWTIVDASGAKTSLDAGRARARLRRSRSTDSAPAAAAVHREGAGRRSPAARTGASSRSRSTASSWTSSTRSGSSST